MTYNYWMQKYLLILPLWVLGLTSLAVMTVNSDWAYLGWTVFFYLLFGGFGTTVGLHRYWTHQTFEMSMFWQRFCTLMGAFNGQGPLFVWIANHEDYHHKYSDTEKDPHSPDKGFFHALVTWTTKSDASSYKELAENPRRLARSLVKYKKFFEDPWNLFVDKWFLAILWGTVALVALIDWKISLYGIVLAVFYNQIAQGMSNTFGHYRWAGYRNYDTNDNSVNNPFLALFTLGELNHNNHHGNWKSWKLSKNWYEPDFGGLIVDLIRKK